MSKTAQPKPMKLYMVKVEHRSSYSSLHFRVTAYEHEKIITSFVVSEGKLKDYERFLCGFGYVRAYTAMEMQCELEEAECKVGHAQEAFELLSKGVIWNPKES